MKYALLCAFVLLAACGKGAVADWRQGEDHSDSSSDGAQLTAGDDVSADVDSFYVTISTGRSGAAGPCRRATFRIVSDQPLTLQRAYRDEPQDVVKQLDERTLQVTSNTLNGRDGLVLIVARGASLRLESEGQGLVGCESKPDAEAHAMVLDLSAFTADEYAPPRTGVYGRHWPFARLEKFITNRYSVRATFRIGPDKGATLGTQD